MPPSYFTWGVSRSVIYFPGPTFFSILLAFNGENLVVFGGSSGSGQVKGYDSEKATTISSEVLFYNIKTNTWINETIVPPGSETDHTNNQETASKTDAIGGGTAAGVIISASDKSGSNAYHLCNNQPEPLRPNAPHKPLDPAVLVLYFWNPAICRNSA
ncbi:hypothetical protein K457DRAFT_26514 [Linnemannia elongata AG-77]|uniref:Galactose oxidase n=1 Tax=Linnemannia elongata AG-77 TaxID=1314771 RepID=A0A197JA42_9FUNG|nr:hypothetical protein K457DRAFT_1882857 [Linnemannia elongata AG-77]OAQ33602.1 hypothetical protein K457DRAFT_26514 [Linnemannia elongata AG-77]